MVKSTLVKREEKVCNDREKGKHENIEVERRQRERVKEDIICTRYIGCQH